MLVISAERNFETTKSKPNTSKNNNKHKIHISEKQKLAYDEHEKICIEWRKQGRPSVATHPAKIAKTLSQQLLQRITREEEALKAQRNNEDLMNPF